MPAALETPSSPDAMYVARGEDAALFEMRPHFTGDVLARGEARAIILQHPCAIRRGLELVPRVLVAEVEPFTGPVPSDWSTGHFKRFFLPDVTGDGATHVANLAALDLWASAEVHQADRLAILALEGVNLLLQRWVFHNTRVVVPSSTLNAVTSGPFAEAEIVSDACQDLVSAGGNLAKAEALVDKWLGEEHHDGVSRRTTLEDSQRRSAIRQQIRTQTRLWIEDEAAH